MNTANEAPNIDIFRILANHGKTMKKEIEIAMEYAVNSDTPLLRNDLENIINMPGKKNNAIHIIIDYTLLPPN
jgi:hypothetical protein